MIDRLDTHLPEWQRRSKSAKQSLPWADFSQDLVEARAVVEIRKEKEKLAIEV